MGTPVITAFIVCCNEEAHIERCLQSVAWCEEIIVVDSGSTDKTLEICKKFTSQIFHREWTGYVEQKQFALSQCTGEWILNLDADEEISPELKEEVQQVLARDKLGKVKENGFFISRVVFYLGRWWRKGGWYPEYRLRFARRHKTSWAGTDPHEKAIVEGPTGKLKGELLHYTYKNITDQIARLNRYSSTAAQQLYVKGKKASVSKLIGRPLARFFKFYILKRGYRDGVAGFIVALLETYYVFLKYVKLWELNRKS